MLIWRPLFAGERFLFDCEDPGTGSFTPGYAITLRMKNHRHCDCLRSSPVVYVAEHVPSRRRSWPMNDAFTVPSARHFLLANPILEPVVGEGFLARKKEIKELDLAAKIRVSYGYIIRPESENDVEKR